MYSMKTILGAMCKIGQRLDGVQFAPSVMNNYLKDKWGAHKYKYQAHNIVTVQDYIKLSDIHQTIDDPITLGGDHSIAMATIRSSLMKHADLKVLWIDAHADLNTPISSSTKNMHGMPLSTLLGDSNIIDVPVKLKSHNLTYIGLRDLDRYEVTQLGVHRIKWHSSEEISTKGTGHILNTMGLSDSDKIHVSIDVDVLDPQYFPATGTPVKDGIHPSHLTQILHYVKQNIIAIDIVEYNPHLDNSDECKHIIRNIIDTI